MIVTVTWMLKSPPCELIHKLNPYLTKVTHSYIPKLKKKNEIPPFWMTSQ